MALVQTELRFRFGDAHDNGVAAAERALSLDPDLAEAHCVKARYLAEQGRHDEARSEIATALKLDPESWEVNKEAARLLFRNGDIEGAIPFFEKATNLMDTDYHDSGLLAVCYTALNRSEAAQQWARITVKRAEKALSQDLSNGAALGHGAYAMACLGQAERAKEWIDRALLVDPDNLIVRYNLACALTTQLNDAEAALDLLEPYFAAISLSQVNYTEVDPDLDSLRTHPRFVAMVADAKSRCRTDA
jgi:adenylate cyclase